MSWGFFTKEGVFKEGIVGTSGFATDSDKLDGKDSTAFIQATGIIPMTAALTLHTTGDPGAAAAAISRSYAQSTFATLAGGTFTGDITLAAGIDLVLSTTSELVWSDVSIARTGISTLSVGSGKIQSSAIPSSVNDLVNKNYVDSTFLPLSGGTLTGGLTLAAGVGLSVPDGTTLNWSDVSISRSAPGVLTLGALQYLRAPAAPVDASDLVNKAYADSLGGGGTLGALSNVDNAVDTPVNGHVLTFDGGIDNRWEATAPPWMYESGGTMTGDLVINVGTPNDAQITFDNGDTAGDIIIESFKLAEAEPMFRAVTDGRLYWGPGGAVAVDTSLYRDNVNSLRTSGSLTIDGKITYNAALNVKTVIKTATYTASLTDDNIILCDTVTPSASITINLPAGHVEGDTFTVKDWAGGAGAFSVVVDADGTETIDGATTYTLNTNYEWVTIVSDGTNWSVIG